MQHGPFLGQVLARREPRRIEAGVCDLLLRFRPEHDSYTSEDGNRHAQSCSRPRDYVRVAGPDAADFLQRMLSNDVEQAPCRAMLLTPKARLIAPLVVVRRADDDFLLLTEPGLGDAVSSALLRAKFAAKVEIEAEEHVSVIALGEEGGIPNDELGEPGAELLDSDAEPTLSETESERLRIEGARPAWGKELDDSILPAEAGLDETHVSFTKGCYPGQEPIARLRYRGKVNRSLRVLEVEGAEPGDEIRYGDKVVGRVTSAVDDRALGYVRVEVPAEAEVSVGGKTGRTLSP